MESFNGTKQECLDSDYLKVLYRRSFRAREGIKHRADTLEASDYERNRWVLANEFIDAFEHLRLPAGHHLACFFTPFADERQSRMVLVKLDLPRLPAIPAALAHWTRSISFTGEREARPAVPDWIEWDVANHLQLDGTPASLFELSIFSRWVGELLNFGHDVFWPRHNVLRGDEDSMELLRLCPDGNDLTIHAVQPRVDVYDADDDSAEHLPSHPDGMQALQGRSRACVRFFTHTAYVRECITEFHDWYVDGRFAGGQSFERATGSNAYIV